MGALVRSERIGFGQRKKVKCNAIIREGSSNVLGSSGPRETLKILPTLKLGG